MDQSLIRSVPLIDSGCYLWMPLTHLAGKIGSLIPLPRVSTVYPPTTHPETEDDGELKESRLAMVAGLIRIMVWVIGISTANDNKRILRARFLRTIVVLWLIDPHHFGCASQASMSRRYGFDKQSFNASVASFRKQFDYSDVRFRSPQAVAHMRKPSRE